MKIEKLQDYVLKGLSEDSKNFDWHIKVWSDIFKGFPDNEKEIYELITSELFDYRRNSVFSNKWLCNPIVKAIMESNYTTDILCYEDKNMTNKWELEGVLSGWLLSELYTRSQSDITELHSIVLNDLKEYWDFAHIIEYEFTESLPNKRLISNLIHFFFFNLFCIDEYKRWKHLKTKDLWEIISLGIEIPNELLRESINKPGFVPNNEHKKWGDLICDFYNTKKFRNT